MSDPQWRNYQPPDPESEEERTLTATAPEHPDNAFTLRSYAAAVIVGGLIAVAAIWYANAADGEGGEGDAVHADPVDTPALDGDVLAGALAEADGIEEGDPFGLSVAENLLVLSYFDAAGGERREVWIDLDETADLRTRTAPENDPDFDPGTFPLDEVDADVLTDLADQAVAEADEPTGFTITIDVPRRADDAVIEVLVSAPDDNVWLTADLDGSNVSIE